MTYARIAAILIVALSAATVNGNWSAAEEQPDAIPGLTVADPNAGWVEIAPDTTLVPTQDTSVAADSGDHSDQ
jgi:hypothetical protein